MACPCISPRMSCPSVPYCLKSSGNIQQPVSGINASSNSPGPNPVQPMVAMAPLFGILVMTQLQHSGLGNP